MWDGIKDHQPEITRWVGDLNSLEDILVWHEKTYHRDPVNIADTEIVLLVELMGLDVRGTYTTRSILVRQARRSLRQIRRITSLPGRWE